MYMYPWYSRSVVDHMVLLYNSSTRESGRTLDGNFSSDAVRSMEEDFTSKPQRVGR